MGFTDVFRAFRWDRRLIANVVPTRSFICITAGAATAAPAYPNPFGDFLYTWVFFEFRF